jgi:hypothetical protein
LIASNRELKEKTDRLYFDQYRYSFKLQVKDFSCLREIRSSTKTQTEVEFIVTKRFAKRLSYDRFWTYTSPGLAIPGLAILNVIEEQTTTKMRLDCLMDLLGHLWPVRNQVKIMFSGDWGYIYSNDRDLLIKIDELPYVTGYYIKEAVVSRTKNTVVLKSSAYQFRSYFAYKKYDEDKKARIQDYLKNQPDVKIGRGLNHWLKYKISDWSRRHYYFDHNDPKIELMLQLMFPDIIRTTMPIIEVNN